MSLRSIGASIMRRIRCFAVGGFKIINGLPEMGKGPMSNEKDLGTRDEASLPQPTRAGRIETCMELIRQAMRCLENNDEQCVTRLIEELIKANCHNGYVVGKETVDKVKDVIHELWLRSNNECRCRLLRMLRDLGISKKWVKSALATNTEKLKRWLIKCDIDWEGKATMGNVVKEIEGLLRRLGWSETLMCEELFKFIGIDVDAFKRHGIVPCVWLNGLESLDDLRRPYWLGLRASDLVVRELDDKIRLELKTTNTIDAVFFAKILNTVKTPSLTIEWRWMPTAKYVSKSIALSYYVYLSVGAWTWPIELSVDELKRILDGFSDEELAEYIAGEIDGDGMVWYNEDSRAVYVKITTCKNCPKRFILDVLKEVIAERFGIVENIDHFETVDALVFGGEKAVKLLRRIAKYIHHPLRRLRAELILAYYEGRIDDDKFEELYNIMKYELGGLDVKRNNALEALTRAAPQTHTHGI